VHTLIVDIAQYLLYVLALVAAVVWLVLNRAGKVTLAAQAVLGLALVGIFIFVAGHLHTDWRPFHHNPRVVPFFPHADDNGFPSDHSAAAGLLAALVFWWKRLVGVLVGVGAALIAWSRVAAHVHHLQDVLAGLLMGAAAGALAIWVVSLLLGMARNRGLNMGPLALTTADRAASRRHRSRGAA
jgi:membrane-associated phospholipid phosphatase